MNAGVTLHVETFYGIEQHHIAESCFQGPRPGAPGPRSPSDPREADGIPPRPRERSRHAHLHGPPAARREAGRFQRLRARDPGCATASTGRRSSSRCCGLLWHRAVAAAPPQGPSSCSSPSPPRWRRSDIDAGARAPRSRACSSRSFDRKGSRPRACAAGPTRAAAGRSPTSSPPRTKRERRTRWPCRRFMERADRRAHAPTAAAAAAASVASVASAGRCARRRDRSPSASPRRARDERRHRRLRLRQNLHSAQKAFERRRPRGRARHGGAGDEPIPPRCSAPSAWCSPGSGPSPIAAAGSTPCPAWSRPSPRR